MDLGIKNYDLSYYDPIVDSIPRAAYKHLISGQNSDGNSALVFVLELGYDRKALEGVTVTPDGFPEPSLNVLTLGIWEC